MSTLLISVFESKFKEGVKDASTGDCDCRGRPSMPLLTLPGIEPFEVLHPLLYYLYTERTCFTTTPIEEAKSFYNVPPFDAEDAYRVGDILGLPELKEKALNFLVTTSDGSNIVSRVFGDYALKYKEIGHRYEAVFYKHWTEIKKSDELKQYFEELKEEADKKRGWKAIMRFLEIAQGLKV
jgi:hypothetical protein